MLAIADTCALCKEPLTAEFAYPHPLSRSVDHIIPIDAGGAPYDLNNLQPSHLGCNRKKGTTITRKLVTDTTSRDW